MSPRWALAWALALGALCGTARAQHGGGACGHAGGLGHGAAHHLGITTFPVPAAVGPPPLVGYGPHPTIYGIWGPLNPMPAVPPLTVLGGVGAGAFSPPSPPILMRDPLAAADRIAPPPAARAPAPGEP